MRLKYWLMPWLWPGIIKLQSESIENDADRIRGLRVGIDCLNTRITLGTAANKAQGEELDNLCRDKRSLKDRIDRAARPCSGRITLSDGERQYAYQFHVDLETSIPGGMVDEAMVRAVQEAVKEVIQKGIYPAASGMIQGLLADILAEAAESESLKGSHYLRHPRIRQWAEIARRIKIDERNTSLLTP